MLTILSQCISEFRTYEGVCYVVGSIAAFTSVVTTAIAVSITPENHVFVISTAFLGMSYLLKLPYYYTKKLAFIINGSLAVGWFSVFCFSFVSFVITDKKVSMRE